MSPPMYNTLFGSFFIFKFYFYTAAVIYIYIYKPTYTTYPNITVPKNHDVAPTYTNLHSSRNLLRPWHNPAITLGVFSKVLPSILIITMVPDYYNTWPAHSSSSLNIIYFTRFIIHITEIIIISFTLFTHLWVKAQSWHYSKYFFLVKIHQL